MGLEDKKIYNLSSDWTENINLNNLGNLTAEEGYSGTYEVLSALESMIRNSEFFETHKEEIFQTMDLLRAEYAEKAIKNNEDYSQALGSSMKNAIKKVRPEADFETDMDEIKKAFMK